MRLLFDAQSKGNSWIGPVWLILRVAVYSIRELATPDCRRPSDRSGRVAGFGNGLCDGV